MNKTVSEAKAFSLGSKELVATAGKNRILLGVAPSYLGLQTVKENNPELIVLSQNVYFEEKGAFTGEISIPMLQDIKLDGSLIGHSERRGYFHEDSLSCHKKIKKLLSADLYALYCVGETLAEFEKGQTKEVVGRQIKEGLSGLDLANSGKLIIAYEPVWSIGTGKNASAEIAQDVCGFIRHEIASVFDEKTAGKIQILYGGSVKPANIREYLLLPDVDGALVGGASLEIESYKALLTAIV